MRVFEYRSHVEASAAEVFKWHARGGAIERLAPPWQPVRIVEQPNGLAEGSRAVLQVAIGPATRRWVAIHRNVQEGREFTDEQVEGPFAAWRHTHRFIPADEGGCTVEDRVEYALPAGRLGEWLGGSYTRRALARLFEYRHEQLRQDLARHKAAGAPVPRRIVVTGATGLVGSRLCAFLSSGGHRVDRLVRGMPRPGSTDIHWKPAEGRIDAASLEGVDAVVHLAGESLAHLRWHERRKLAILQSRVEGTRLLCRALADLRRPPRVLVSASAIGYYGDRGDEVLTEDSPAGGTFLAEVCQAWEAAADPARQAGIRVVHPRIGMVLAGDGGALVAMLKAFRPGLGGTLGSGRQHVSWIDIDDLLGILHFAVFREDLAGAINAVSPNSVTNRQFTRTLGRVLSRPTFLNTPAPLLRLLAGPLAENVLLASARVAPARLQAAGFAFFYPDLEACLRHQLGRPARTQPAA